MWVTSHTATKFLDYDTIVVPRSDIRGREKAAQNMFRDMVGNALWVQSGSDALLIVLSGMDGHFGYLNKCQSFDGDILHLRDPSHTWFQNSGWTLEDVADYVKTFLAANAFKRIILLGDSFGAYGALYLTPQIGRAVCIAISPQTFQLSDANIHLAGGVHMTQPYGSVLKFRQYLTLNTAGTKFVFVGRNESNNSDGIMWGDLLSAGNLIDVRNVQIIVTQEQHHAVMWYMDAEPLLRFILENYDLCIDNAFVAAQDIAANHVTFFG